MLNVAIALDSAVDYGPQAAHVVSAACEEVIGERRCPVAGELAPGTVAAWYAVVHPNDRRLASVRIEFRDRTADGVLIEARELTFSSRDTDESRLASIGTVIAALAAAREGPLPPAPPAPTRPAAAEWPPWSVELAALAAATSGDAPTRAGGLARAVWDFGARPFGLVSARYAEARSGEPRYAWLTLALGGGARIAGRGARLDLEVNGEGVFERTSVSIDRGAAHDSAAQSGWGGRLGVDAAWAAWRHCALLLGVDGTLVLPRINVIVADGAPTRLGLVTVGLWAGVRFAP